jgi:nucleotide-binding universal stress UspA family protein
MIAIRNILYATDFSPYANQAYFHAVALAESYGATLTIVHVYNPVVPSSFGVDVGAPPPAVDPTADEEHWRGQLEQIRPVNPRLAVRHALLTGDPAEAILRHAEATQADLVVMGTHGRTGLARLLMGSVAERVLRGAPCSVLVVKMPKAPPAPEVKA